MSIKTNRYRADLWKVRTFITVDGLVLAIFVRWFVYFLTFFWSLDRLFAWNTFGTTHVWTACRTLDILCLGLFVLDNTRDTRGSLGKLVNYVWTIDIWTTLTRSFHTLTISSITRSLFSTDPSFVKNQLSNTYLKFLKRLSQGNRCFNELYSCIFPKPCTSYFTQYPRHGLLLKSGINRFGGVFGFLPPLG